MSFLICFNSIYVAETVSTGTSKKPCVWSACKSQIVTLVAPEFSISLLTNLQVIGSLDSVFLSCLE